MNAARYIASHLPRADCRHLVRRLGVTGSGDGAIDRAWTRLYELDLVSLLNTMRKVDLERIAGTLKLDCRGPVGALRTRLWQHFAILEAGGPEQIDSAWQPMPSLLAGRLVLSGPVRGLAPPAIEWPRPVPVAPGKIPSWGDDEPECLEDLLGRADALVGVRLGVANRDKGRFGTRVAQLLGVPERGYCEPDWRGEVELKTVPVVRDSRHRWRVKEDPAVAMEGVDPESKLGRVLWIARVADAEDSPILSWYYLEWDAVVAELARRTLHRRPKGPRGATTRGWYLQKRFFAGAGFLRTLNGA